MASDKRRAEARERSAAFFKEWLAKQPVSWQQLSLDDFWLAFAESERSSAIKEAREECARIADKYKTTMDASVDCSDGRRRQIIEFDGQEIARQIRALGER